MDLEKITRDMLNEMSKDEFISLFDEFRNQRAFTYTDQMKLAILDKSPFTIWASDRDCKITFWEGQCQTLYGYSRDDALGKDYLELFVAEDERAAARQDQRSIIDNAAVFHNIANDIAKHRNTLQLITNCFRLWDWRTEQYWNVEMGLIIDYFEQEKERLELVLAESKKVKSCIQLFTENTKQRKIQYRERKKAIKTAIAESKKKAAAVKKLKAFEVQVTMINVELEKTHEKLSQLIDDYTQKIQACIDTISCESLMLEFDEICEEIFYEFEDIVINFVEINSEFSWDNTVIQLRDELLKVNFASANRLVLKAHELFKKADDEIYEYKKLKPKHDAPRLKMLVERRDLVQSLQDSITVISDEYIDKVPKATDDDSLKALRSIMIAAYKEVDDKLLRLKAEMEGVT